jgi:hypothetical protein
MHRFPQKSRSHLKIQTAGRVTYIQSHTEDPKILGVTLQNLVGFPGLVHT